MAAGRRAGPAVKGQRPSRMQGPPDGIIQNALLTHSGLCGHGPGGTYVVADWAEAAEAVIVTAAIVIINLRVKVMSFSVGFEGERGRISLHSKGVTGRGLLPK